MSYLPSKLPEFSPPVVEMEPWRKALMDAAELIRVRGHAKRIMQDDCGRLCVHGAIMAAEGKEPSPRHRDSTEPELALRAYLVRRNPNIGQEFPTVAAWNNAKERTAAEVIAALEAAARS